MDTNPRMKEYFLTLPAFVQETIMQSGAAMHSESELRSCAENLMEK